MIRGIRPFARLATAAAVLAAGTAAVVAAPMVTSSPAAATYSCGSGDSSFSVGDGSAATPYIVTNSAQLAALEVGAGSVGKHYRLECDLDLVAQGYTNWTPIGGDSTNSFQGTLNGGGRTISNLVMNSGSGYNLGLFGFIRDATVSSLTLHGVTISAGTDDTIGALASHVDTTTIGASLSDITVSAANIQGGTNISGVIGYLDVDAPVSISNVLVSGTNISGETVAGGAIAEVEFNNASLTLTNVVVHADVTVSGVTGGGVIGETGAGSGLNQAAISGVHYSGNIISTSTTFANSRGKLGGIVGYLALDDGAVTITDSTATGTVTGAVDDDYLGGLIGRAELDEGRLTIDQTSSSVDVSGSGTPNASTGSNSEDMGGLVGSVYITNGGGSFTLTNSSASGDVTAPTSDEIGGLIGDVEVFHSTVGGAVTVSASTASGVLSGRDNTGGIIGLMDADDGVSVMLDRVVYTGPSVASSEDLAGGLLGSANFYAASRVVITNATTSGQVSGENSVGGVIGYLEYPNGVTTLADITSLANVSASSTVGGLIGEIYGSSSSNLAMSNLHARGSVTASGVANTARWSGGFIGDWTIEGGSYTLEDSTAAGTLHILGPTGTAAYDHGGFIGSINFYEGNITISGSTSSVDVIRDGNGSNLGGFLGRVTFEGDDTSSFEIVDSHATGDVIAPDADWLGGFIGEMEGAGDDINPVERGEATVSASSASGAVVGYDYVGGFIGLLNAGQNMAVSITDSQFLGSTVTGHAGVGGFIGLAQARYSFSSVSIHSVTSSAAVNGDDYVGGLFSEIEADDGGVFTFTDAIATSPVTGTGDDVGGMIARLIGDDRGVVLVSNLSSSADVSGAGDNVGGLIGYIDTPNGSGMSVTISAVSASGNVSASASSVNVGGLVGAVEDSTGLITIEQVAATGTVRGDDQLGGLIGSATVSTGELVVRRSFAGGDVTNIGPGSNKEFGGFASIVNVTSTGSIVLEDVYATGDVTTGPLDKVGGLVGDILLAGGGSVNVTRTHAVGSVNGGTAGTDVGGLIGRAAAGVSVTGSFWDTAATGQAASAGGTGKSTAEMTTAATFNGAGWSITNGDTDLSKVWGVCSGTRYPFLMWQTQLAAGLAAAASCSGGGNIDPGTNTPGGGGLPSGLGGLVVQPVPTSSTTTTTVPPSTTVPPTTVAPTVDTPSAPPVEINGALPDLPAGDVVVVEDGEPVAVEVYVENDTELVVESSRFELRLKGDCTEADCTIDTTSEGREVLTLQEDGAANVDGIGFKPGSLVDVWLFSEPRYLGQMTVLADGTFEGDVPLADIAVGEHTLQVNGISQTGAQRSANLGVIVNPQQAPTPGNGGTLPATGTSTTPIWLVALALLGLGLVATGRRRSMR